MRPLLITLLMTLGTLSLAVETMATKDPLIWGGEEETQATTRAAWRQELSSAQEPELLDPLFAQFNLSDPRWLLPSASLLPVLATFHPTTPSLCAQKAALQETGALSLWQLTLLHLKEHISCLREPTDMGILDQFHRLQAPYLSLFEEGHSARPAFHPTVLAEMEASKRPPDTAGYQELRRCVRASLPPAMLLPATRGPFGLAVMTNLFLERTFPVCFPKRKYHGHGVFFDSPTYGLHDFFHTTIYLEHSHKSILEASYAWLKPSADRSEAEVMSHLKPLIPLVAEIQTHFTQALRELSQKLRLVTAEDPALEKALFGMFFFTTHEIPQALFSVNTHLALTFEDFMSHWLTSTLTDRDTVADSQKTDPYSSPLTGFMDVPDDVIKGVLREEDVRRKIPHRGEPVLSQEVTVLPRLSPYVLRFTTRLKTGCEDRSHIHNYLSSRLTLAADYCAFQDLAFLLKDTPFEVGPPPCLEGITDRQAQRQRALTYMQNVEDKIGAALQHWYDILMRLATEGGEDSIARRYTAWRKSHQTKIDAALA